MQVEYGRRALPRPSSEGHVRYMCTSSCLRHGPPPPWPTTDLNLRSRYASCQTTRLDTAATALAYRACRQEGTATRPAADTMAAQTAA
eukprot:357202-Chlamydomonas_euryale.AAC.13